MTTNPLLHHLVEETNCCHRLHCFGFSIAFGLEKEEAVIRTLAHHLNILRERQPYVIYIFYG